MNPLAPAIVQVDDSTTKKTMLWPLKYALPGQDAESLEPLLDQFQQQMSASDTTNVDLLVVPERVVAVARFSDAITEPAVRKVDLQLRELCRQDGLTIQQGATIDDVAPSSPLLMFAQYDAVFSMGKRRSEVQIELAEGGHPW
jgi:hypothetical protein